MTDHDTARVTLGVIADPGQAADLARQVVTEGLAAMLDERLPGAGWEVVVEEDRLVNPPADDTALVDAARRRLLERDWDLVVCLTELPLHRNRRPVVAHANPMHGVAVLSVPALGALGRRARARHVIADLLSRLLGVGDAADEDAADQLRRRVRELGTDVDAQPAAFTARVLTGNLRLLTGMVRANQPWRLTLRLSRALAAAAAAAVFALVTADIWRLADTFGGVRLTVAAIASILAIVVTIIVGGGLWERATGSGLRQQVVLFNLATTATVIIGVVAFYAALLVLAGAAAACLVVPSVLREAVGHPVSVSDYAELAWLTCSLGTLGGALGAGLETDDAVREAAYVRQDSDYAPE
ncbi:hypothetical protein LV457_17355 [Mycobacterium sp. MYCO198283]|uniref:hypothetical protein n=1 Tax=Mycobacterium sp. MYCO198283 TaxID=2883505 RepID=UPI001E4D2EAE|nr:hypothetical protein [Mycobacterium sp. MYCO198283]MCG5434042.1 hypothetical protein [Mycobacterium sp. MYCO198283]